MRARRVIFLVVSLKAGVEVSGTSTSSEMGDAFVSVGSGLVVFGSSGIISVVSAVGVSAGASTGASA